MSIQLYYKQNSNNIYSTDIVNLTPPSFQIPYLKTNWVNFLNTNGFHYINIEKDAHYYIQELITNTYERLICLPTIKELKRNIITLYDIKPNLTVEKNIIRLLNRGLFDLINRLKSTTISYVNLLILLDNDETLCHFWNANPLLTRIHGLRLVNDHLKNEILYHLKNHPMMTQKKVEFVIRYVYITKPKHVLLEDFLAHLPICNQPHLSYYGFCKRFIT